MPIDLVSHNELKPVTLHSKKHFTSRPIHRLCMPVGSWSTNVIHFDWILCTAQLNFSSGSTRQWKVLMYLFASKHFSKNKSGRTKSSVYKLTLHVLVALG